MVTINHLVLFTKKKNTQKQHKTTTPIRNVALQHKQEASQALLTKKPKQKTKNN